MNVQSKKFMSNHAADMVMDVKMLLWGGGIVRMEKKE